MTTYYGEMYKGIAIALIGVFPNDSYAPQGDMFKRTYRTLSAAKVAITKYLNSVKVVEESKDTETVIRIENAKGEGMYNAGGENGGPHGTAPNLFHCPGYHNDEAHHPRPEDDSEMRREMIKRGLFDPNNYRDNPFAQMLLGMVGFTNDAEKYSYGFSNIEQARHWLYKDEWLHYLDTHGFKVAIIKLPKGSVVHGSTQAMFIKPESYEKVSIKEFFKLS